MKTQFTPPHFQYASLFVTLFLSMLCASLVRGQNSSFYTMVAPQDKYFDSVIKVRGAENMKGTGYVPYLRWKLNWMRKVGNSGTIEGAYEAMRNFSSNYTTIRNTFTTTNAIWSSMGPFKWPVNIPLDDNSSMVGVGRIHSIAFDPGNPNRIYAMSPSWGGLYRSNNYGSSWIKMDTETDEVGEGLGVLLVDHTDSNILYLTNGDCDANYYKENSGMSQSLGIYRSINGGNNWTQIFATSTTFQRGHQIRKMLLDPNNHNVLFVVTDYGLYKCINPTSTNPVFDLKLEHSFTDIEYRAGSNNEIYVSGRGHDYLYVSYNDGETFTKVTNPYFSETTQLRTSQIEFSAADPNTLFLMGSFAVPKYKDDVGILFTLSINTNQWVKSDTLFNVVQVQKGFAVAPGNANEIYVGGMMNTPILKSLDKGLTWTQMLSNYHIDIHHLDFSNTGELWAATDGGICKYNKTSDNWTDFTDMSLSNIGKYSCSVAQSDTNFILMGCYDNGSSMMNRNQAGTNKWNYVNGGDGTACVFDHVDANTFYTSTLGDVIMRHDWANNNTTYQLSPKAKPDQAYNSLVVDAINHNLIYTKIDSAVYRSYSKGNDGSWQKISVNLNNGARWPRFFRLVTSPVMPGVVYVQNWYLDTIQDRIYNNWWRTFNADATMPADVIWEEFTYNDSIYLNDLVLDPNNPRRGWAAVAGYYEPVKVLQFDENGWYNITGNLVNNNSFSVPGVSCLAYDRASSDGNLYAGTWKGVFYLSKGSTEWKLLDGMPDADITNIDIQYLSGKLIVSTYGKGIWETRLRNTTCNGPVVINTDSTLFNGGFSACDILIKTGKTFTIKGTLTMGQNARIMVERGAKLIVDGGKITGMPGFMWKGIEVWGDSSATQQNNGLYQGMAKFINKAIIENAETATATIRINGTPDYAYTGGIIIANDAIFRNCTKAVVFYKYETYTPFSTKVGNNASWFSLCTFETDNNYLSLDTVCHVSLYQVRGIAFRGCVFSNTNVKHMRRSTGIFAYNSSFRVEPACRPLVYPCQVAQQCTFTNLRYGVRALGAATTKTFKIEKSVFVKNNCGVYAAGIDYIQATENDFFITSQDTSTNLYMAFSGLYFDRCKFYTIEENTFSWQFGGSEGKSVGLTINSSGPDNNQVYKNTFNSLDIGILAQRVNRNPANSDGLCLRCNNFNTCKYDIAVTKPSNGSLTENGIALAQGSQSYPAGNLFTPTTYTGLLYNFYNLNEPTPQQDPPDITYYHHIQDQFHKTIPDLRTNVVLPNPQSDYNDTTCASHLGGGITPADKLASADAEAIEQQALITQLVDGGETEATASEVVYAMPAEALELRDDLLQKSPYLSDTVMKEAIENEYVLNNALLRDVLVANPQSAKSDDLMLAVDERANSMPEYMQEEIEAGANVISPKEQLENELAMARSEADGWYHSMVGDMLHDTTGVDMEALQNLFESRPSPSNAYFSALQQLESGDSLAGFELLAEIPATFSFNQNQMDEHNILVEKLSILQPVLFSGIPVTVADSLTVANLIELYCSGEPSGNSWLRNTLVALDKIDFIEEYILPDNLKSTEATIPEKKSVSYELMLKVFPNPAKDYIIIEYHAAKAGSSVIQLTDAVGRPVDQISISKESDQITYITTKLHAGLYTCSLWIAGKNKANVKFNVIR